MTLKGINGPGDLAENGGSPIEFGKTDAVIEALTTDSGKLGELLKMSTLSGREQYKARRTLDAALRLGATQVVIDVFLEISGSPGRDGDRAEKVTAVGGVRNDGYYELAKKRQQSGGLKGAWNKIWRGNSQNTNQRSPLPDTDPQNRG